MLTDFQTYGPPSEESLVFWLHCYFIFPSTVYFHTEAIFNSLLPIDLILKAWSSLNGRLRSVWIISIFLWSHPRSLKETPIETVVVHLRLAGAVAPPFPHQCPLSQGSTFKVLHPGDGLHFKEILTWIESQNNVAKTLWSRLVYLCVVMPLGWKSPLRPHL